MGGGSRKADSFFFSRPIAPSGENLLTGDSRILGGLDGVAVLFFCDL